MTATGRPVGQPGTVVSPRGTRREAVLETGDWLHVKPNTCGWLGLRPVPLADAESLGWVWEPDVVPEWVTRCPHPRVCGTETDCDALAREDERVWGR